MAECAVCLADYVQPCRTPCGHVYCRDCLRATLKSRPPWNRGACPLCRSAVSVYNTVDIASGEALETPSRTTIFGESYLQHGEKGVASYHFPAPDDCYISYENAPAAWVLDDGTRPPTRKPFLNPRYDAATRTFRGTIDWSDNNFHGDARWEYEMVFADDFVTIAGGQMNGFDREGNATRTSKFPETLRYVREYEMPSTIVGQAYMQGGGLGVASYHFPEIDQAYISYEAAPPQWTRDDGQPPPQQKPFVNPRYDAATRTFTGTIDWSDNNFHGDARWEYEMVFSEDFSRITGGQVRGGGACACTVCWCLRLLRVYEREVRASVRACARMEPCACARASALFFSRARTHTHVRACPLAQRALSGAGIRFIRQGELRVRLHARSGVRPLRRRAGAADAPLGYRSPHWGSPPSRRHPAGRHTAACHGLVPFADWSHRWGSGHE